MRSPQPRTDTVAVPTEAKHLEAGARELLSQATFDFIAGGAGAELTLADNQAAFQRARLMPRHLRGVETVDSSTRLLGLELSAPILVAPMALHRLVHSDGERGMARATRRAGLAMVASTAASESIEEMATERCPIWFQVYMQRDRDVTQDLVERAVSSGATALCLTVDTPVPGLRRRDQVNGFSLPPGIEYANLERYNRLPGSGKYGAAHDRSATWADVEWLRSISGLPVVVKGILTVADAHEAIANGAAGVLVSNHGGRQLDGVPATLDVLPGIAEAVADRGAVLVDSGIRQASDVAIALCLGADAVLIGRPALWALACGGTSCAEAFLGGLVDELVHTMTLLGVRTVDEFGPEFVQAATRGRAG